MNLLNQLFTGPENILWFVIGVVSVQVWQWIKCKWKDRQDPKGKPHPMKKVNWFYVWTAFVLVVIIGVGFQNARTYSFAEELARTTRECQVEFNQALQFNANITRQNDEYSQIQRKALADWIHDLIFPPPNIAILPVDSEIRQQWNIARTTEADTVIRKAQVEQDINLKERKPYPDPTCGK